MSDATLQQIAVATIKPSPHNPRRFRKDDAELASLADSIRAKGVLQPILVRPLPDPAGEDPVPQFELIAGERRWRASQAAGRSEIPAIVREGLTDQEALELTVLENLQREDLSPLEEAAGVASLLTGGKPLAEVADQLGKPLSWVARRARLASLSPKWRDLATDAKSQASIWPASWLELVARLDSNAQDEFLELHRSLRTNNDWEIWNLLKLERELANWTHELARAPWDAKDATLLPVIGACTACPKRSSVHPGLFDDEEIVKGKRVAAGDRCLDAVCWDKKADQHFERVGSDLVAKHRDLVIAESHGKKPLPAFARGRKVVESWKGTAAKKGDPGALPVLTVHGTERGKLEWRKFGKDGGAAKGGKSEAPKVKSMAERRAQLAARRQAWMLKAVCGRLLLTAVPPSETLLRLLAKTGTKQNLDRPDTSWPKSDPKDISLALFDSVVAVLTRRWELRLRWEGTKGMKQSWSEIEEIAAAVGLDLDPFESDAAKAIPEPKSWAKAAPAAKGTKKAKPSKPGKGKR